MLSGKAEVCISMQSAQDAAQVCGKPSVIHCSSEEVSHRNERLLLQGKVLKEHQTLSLITKWL